MSQYLYYTSAVNATTLASSLGAAGSPSVNSVTGFPANYPFKLLIDWGLSSQEAILVTSAPTGTGPYTVPCIRGVDGTTAQVHSSGAQVVHGFSADELNILSSLGLVVTGTQFGADPTGSADSTSAIQAAINTLPATGGTVYLPAGTYKVSSTITVNSLLNVYIRGAGRWATKINFTGTGDCLRVYDTDTTGRGSGGGVLDLTIDGTSAGNGSAGLHYGDQRGGELRVAVQNFSGTGSIGVHFDNQYAWTEQTHGYLFVSNCTQLVVFDVSAPAGGSYTATNASPCVFTCASPTFTNGTQVVLSGGTAPTGFTNGTGYFVVNASGTTFQLSATSGGSAINSTSTGNGTVTQATATNSYGYTVLDMLLEAKNFQDGLVLQNGALLYHSRVCSKGNFKGTSTANSSAAIRITGTVPAGHPGAGGGSSIANSRFDFMVECTNASGSNAPQTINFGTPGTNTLINCTGILDFTFGSLAFATTNYTPLSASGTFQYMGYVAGDFNLSAQAQSGLAKGGNWLIQAPIIYGPSNFVAGTGVMLVDKGDFFKVTLTQNLTVNMTSGGSCYNAPQRKTVIITQAAAGGPYTVTWPHTGSPTTGSPTVNWAGGTAPTMSAGASAVDVYELVTYDGATWVGQAIQNVS